MAETSAEGAMQERQKTVIAFVAGLLIGGLLVWVFTSTQGGSSKNNDTMVQDDDTSMEDDSMMEGDNDGAMMEDTGSDSNTNGGSMTVTPSPNGDGSLTVADQDAGTSVALGNVEFPTEAGWVVVKDGDGTGILGAARYDTNVGLIPSDVALLRSTEAGSDYMVVFYTENGDRVFDTSSDMQMSGTAEAVFTAR